MVYIIQVGLCINRSEPNWYDGVVMEEITVTENVYLEKLFYFVRNLPFGCAFASEVRLARNYGSGLFLTLGVDYLIPRAQKVLTQDQIPLERAIKILKENNFSDSEIEVLYFVSETSQKYGNGSRLKNAEFVLTGSPLINESITIHVLQLRVENKVIAQQPVISNGVEQHNMGPIQGFAGAKQLIDEQGCVLFIVSDYVRWLIPARVDSN